MLIPVKTSCVPKSNRSISSALSKRTRPRNLKGFARDRSGNIAILFVFMSTVLFLFVGGAVDYTRWNAVRADMIESMDAASLAVAQLAAADDTLTPTQLEAYGDAFFQENFDYEDQLLNGWNIDFDLANSAVISTCITGKISTFLLGVAGITELDIDQCVEIIPQGSGRIELALVLDVTGSMGQNDPNGQKKIDSLRTAVTALLDVLFEGNPTSDNVRVGVVPFNQHVNSGASSGWTNSWGDLNGVAAYNGARFFHVDENGVVDATRKVNHYDLFNSDPDRSWDGCMEARPYPLDELDTEPGMSTSTAIINAAMQTPSSADEPDALMRSAFINMPSINTEFTVADLATANNSRWVPVFMADEPDCGHTDDCDNGDYSESGTVNGITWSGFWFDDPDDDNILTSVKESSYSNRYYSDSRRFTNYTQGTPFNKYVPIVYHFREVNQGNITDAPFLAWMTKQGVQPVTGFGRQEYIMRTGYVGWWDPATQTYDYRYDLPKDSASKGPNYSACAEPILPLTDTRADIDGAGTGIMEKLVATGATNIPAGAVWGWRVVSPDAPFTEAIGPGETGPGSTVFEDWQKAVVIMTDGENWFGSRNTHWGSSLSAFGYEIEERMGDGVDQTNAMENEADNKILRICRRMKEDNVLVYTIVFDVNVGSTIENIFKSCASAPTAPYFFNAPDGDELATAFGDIADDLVKLHISK
jgi:Putative Flp pilus-assembly TadE/G-like